MYIREPALSLSFARRGVGRELRTRGRNNCDAVVDRTDLPRRVLFVARIKGHRFVTEVLGKLMEVALGFWEIVALFVLTISCGTVLMDVFFL